MNNNMIAMHMKELFFKTLLCLGFILGAFIIIAVPVRAEDTVPKIEVLPAEGTVGTTVFVRIWDYTPNKQVLVLFGTGNTISTGTVVVAKETTDDTGYAVVSFPVDLLPAGSYTVTADDGTNKKPATFKITPKIALADTSGCVGDVVMVSGNGFTASKPISIFFDDVKMAYPDADEYGKFSEIKFILPSARKGDHNVKALDSGGNSFTAIYNVIQKMWISPVSATANSDVKISGTGFKPDDITIFFDDKDIASLQVGTSGDFTTTIKVPSCSDGIHKIKADDGLNRIYCDLTVLSSITITPSNGNIGMPLNIQGSGFRPGLPITINFDNTKMDASTVNSDGTFMYNFKIPPSRSGPHTITVTDGINIQKTTFAVESTPPLVPTLKSPEELSRVKKGIHFEWSAVSDPSGVSYVLEVAADAKFSQILISTANLNQCAFDFPEDDKLLPSQNNPFYWRVKAIDGAFNEGAWSSVGSFYKGYTLESVVTNMPDWAKYILIGFGVLLVAFMFFWLGRVLKKAGSVDESELESISEPNLETGWEYNAEPNEWNQQ